MTEKTPEGLHATLRNALQALKACSRKCYVSPSADEAETAAERHAQWRAEYDFEKIEAGDQVAVTIGPLIGPIAEAANLNKSQARRYLVELELLGLAMRQQPDLRGTAHRWWPVGFSAELKAERAKVLKE